MVSRLLENSQGNKISDPNLLQREEKEHNNENDVNFTINSCLYGMKLVILKSAPSQNKFYMTEIKEQRKQEMY